MSKRCDMHCINSQGNSACYVQLMGIRKGRHSRESRKSDLAAIIPLLTAESPPSASPSSCRRTAQPDRTRTPASPPNLAKLASLMCQAIAHRFNPTLSKPCTSSLSSPCFRNHRSCRRRAPSNRSSCSRARAGWRSGFPATMCTIARCRVEHVRLQNHPPQQATSGRADQPLAGRDGRRRQAPQLRYPRWHRPYRR